MGATHSRATSPPPRLTQPLVSSISMEPIVDEPPTPTVGDPISMTLGRILAHPALSEEQGNLGTIREHYGTITDDEVQDLVDTIKEIGLGPLTRRRVMSAIQDIYPELTFPGESSTYDRNTVKYHQTSFLSNMKELGKFTHVGGKVDVVTFLTKARDWSKGCGFSDESYIQALGNHLDGAAAQWYESCVRDGNLPTTVPDFEVRLKEAFPDKERDAAIRRAVLSMEPTASVEGFLQKFIDEYRKMVRPGDDKIYTSQLLTAIEPRVLYELRISPASENYASLSECHRKLTEKVIEYRRAHGRDIYKVLGLEKKRSETDRSKKKAEGSVKRTSGTGCFTCGDTEHMAFVCPVNKAVCQAAGIPLDDKGLCTSKRTWTPEQRRVWNEHFKTMNEKGEFGRKIVRPSLNDQAAGY